MLRRIEYIKTTKTVLQTFIIKKHENFCLFYKFIFIEYIFNKTMTLDIR